jgi:hypothetical protein
METLKAFAFLLSILTLVALLLPAAFFGRISLLLAAWSPLFVYSFALLISLQFPSLPQILSIIAFSASILASAISLTILAVSMLSLTSPSSLARSGRVSTD